MCLLLRDPRPVPGVTRVAVGTPLSPLPLRVVRPSGAGRHSPSSPLENVPCVPGMELHGEFGPLGALVSPPPPAAATDPGDAAGSSRKVGVMADDRWPGDAWLEENESDRSRCIISQASIDSHGLASRLQPTLLEGFASRRDSFDLSEPRSVRFSAELAKLFSPGVPGAEPPLTTMPDEELNTESPELPTHGMDGTRRYLGNRRETVCISFSFRSVSTFFSCQCMRMFCSCSVNICPISSCSRSSWSIASFVDRAAATDGPARFSSIRNSFADSNPGSFLPSVGASGVSGSFALLPGSDWEWHGPGGFLHPTPPPSCTAGSPSHSNRRNCASRSRYVNRRLNGSVSA
uniref:Uncharacterized protein n=1 Tax=Anopheles coluzzii TaxID=1518534 RepID=A0A8W7PMS3_ANOCL